MKSRYRDRWGRDIRLLGTTIDFNHESKITDKGVFFEENTPGPVLVSSDIRQRLSSNFLERLIGQKTPLANARANHDRNPLPLSLFSKTDQG